MVNQPVLPLVATNLKAWVSTKGFLVVTAAALLPLGLTGAWVATHQADFAAESFDGPPEFEHGTLANFTGVVKSAGKATTGAANASIAIYNVINPDRPLLVAENVTHLEPMRVGDTREVTLSWNATFGIYQVQFVVDTDDDVGEQNDQNNVLFRQFIVNSRPPSDGSRPLAPAGLGGNETTEENSTVKRVDVSLRSLSWTPETVEVGVNSTFTADFVNDGDATAENVTLTLRILRRDPFMPLERYVPAPGLIATRTVSIPAGGNETLTLPWNLNDPGLSITLGPYWVEAYVMVPQDSADADAGDNHDAKGFALKANIPEVPPPESPAKLTLKTFYQNIVTRLYIPLVVPFIALFYAAGVLADERERGSLAYILTRPVKRWLLPITKFGSSFLVAALSSLIGLVAAFAVLVGSPESDVGFLATSLILSLLALLAYGAFFILLGILVDRPYLVGAAFVIGWEALAPFFVPWVKNLTLSHHLQTAFSGWSIDQGVQLLPQGEESMRAIFVLLGASVAFLAAATYAMRRKEFDL